MALSKQVTYRDARETVISKWNVIKVDPNIWRRVLENKRKRLTGKEKDEFKITDFEDHWNSISLEAYSINYKRTVERNLLNLHWLSPEEMPNALNI